MPYIKGEDRKKFENMLEKCPKMTTKGELEYVMYSLCMIYLRDKELRYSTLHDVWGACHHVGHEISRRLLDKREDKAIIENGDIF